MEAVSVITPAGTITRWLAKWSRKDLIRRFHLDVNG
jgi:hypothetical protein